MNECILYNFTIYLSAVNVTFDLNCIIDLKELATHAHNVSYKASRNKSLFMTLYQPRTRSVVHSSGRVIVMGAENEAQALLASRLHARNIYKIHTCWSNIRDAPNNRPRFSNFHVSHIFGNAELGRRVRIDDVAAQYCRCATFNPQIHPGVKINLTHPKATIVLQRTGKMMISGIKNRLDLLPAFHAIVCMTKPFWIT